MSTLVTLAGRTTEPEHTRVVVRNSAGEILAEAGVVDGAYELQVDVAGFAAAPSLGALRSVFPSLFEESSSIEAQVPRFDEQAEPLRSERQREEREARDAERERMALHLLQQEGWRDEPYTTASVPPEFTTNATLEIFDDRGEQKHAHELLLTQRLAGSKVWFDLAAWRRGKIPSAPPENALPPSFEALDFDAKLRTLWQACKRASDYRPRLLDSLEAMIAGQGALQSAKLRKAMIDPGVAGGAGSRIYPPLDLTRPRRKVVHQVGAVARFRFEPIASPYTGLLGQRSVGLIRCSSSIAAREILAPGIALKFPISQNYSRNLSALVSIEGQGRDDRFFALPMLTLVPPPVRAPNMPWGTRGPIYGAHKRIEDLSRRILVAEGRGNDPGWIPLAPFCDITQQGTPVSAPVTPHELVFEPSIAVQDQWENTGRGNFLDRLTRLARDTILYDVVAQAPGRTEQAIGSLVLDSRFTLGTACDHELHFGHLIPRIAGA